MKRTHACRLKKPQSQPIPQTKSSDPAQSTAPIPSAIQAKSNEEGLAEWKAQQEKWARFGTPWMDKVPNPSGLQPWIQKKLTIGQPGDKYEQEADRVASQVVQQINAPTSTDQNHRQSVQRKKAQYGEMQANCIRAAIQRRQAIASGEASVDLESSINSARSSGQPLDAGLQQSMGQSMGADFSGVKVHTDAQSDHLNKSIQARAFTTGQDVFFRGGAYQPGNRGGQELIAHELTHVVQQRGGTIQKANNINDILRNTETAFQHQSATNAIQRTLMTDKQRQEVYTNMAKSKVAAGYAGMFKKGGKQYLETWLSKNTDYKKGTNYDDEDINLIFGVYKEYKAEIGFLKFDAFVDLLAGVGGKALKYAETMKGLKFKNQPGIVFGFCLTQANYDSAKNVIVVDPFRVQDDLEALDAALFECMNALQRTEMRANFRIDNDKERGLAIAKQEFISECMYIEQLLKINDAKDIDELVVKLGLSKKYLERTTFDKCKKDGVPMPDRSELSRQDARTALWHYKTKGWKKLDREFVWVSTNHGAGIASSMELYSK